MGLAKSSRKGKKAWRRNIDTTEIEEARADALRVERQNISVAAVPDEQLFFVDKAGGPTPSAGAPRRRKEKKTLRSQLIITAHQTTPGITLPAKRKAKGPLTQPKPRAPNPEVPVFGALVGSSEGMGGFLGEARAAKKTRLRDIWEEEPGFEGQGCFADGTDVLRPPRTGPRHRPYHRMQQNPIRALEVDGPGCSYNPDPVVHEETVATAVAVEVRKTLDRELAIKVPSTLTEGGGDGDMDELALLQVDAQPEGESEASDREGEEGGPAAIGSTAERKTRAIRNRAERRKAAEQELSARKALKKQRRDLENLKQVEAEIADMEAVREARRVRKEVEKKEKMAERPPRLGRHLFKPAPIQVLLTEELSGSLRKVKPYAQLAKDRFAALQKRGVIEPRVRVVPKQAKIVQYLPGERTDRARTQQDDLDTLLQSNRRIQKKQQ